MVGWKEVGCGEKRSRKELKETYVMTTKEMAVILIEVHVHTSTYTNDVHSLADQGSLRMHPSPKTAPLGLRRLWAQEKKLQQLTRPKLPVFRFG